MEPCNNTESILDHGDILGHNLDLKDNDQSVSVLMDDQTIMQRFEPTSDPNNSES